MFSLTAFAEKKTQVFDFDITRLQIKYLNGSGASLTPWYNLTPVPKQSPFGGNFLGARNGNEIVDRAMQWNSNWYFNKNILFKGGTEYTIKGYFAVPWDKLVTNDNYFNFFHINISLNDTSRNVIYNLNTENASLESSWIKKKIQYFNVDFGFYPINFSFTPAKDVTGYFFNVYIQYGLLVEPNSRGNFGFSDLTLSYEYDGSQAIIDNQNQNTQDIIDNQNANADKEIQAEQDLYEQEKQDAQQSGDESVDGALESIPNDSDDIISGFDNFLSCMLHTETNCSIEFPALKTPAIMGIPSYTLTEPTELNFNEFEEIIPKAVMLIVRALLTIALIIFCYKELYSTIQYVVTLKKGGGD